MGRVKIEFADGKTLHVAGIDGEIFSVLQEKYETAIVKIDNQKSAYFSMNFEAIIAELMRLKWKDVAIKKEILSMQKNCDHDHHVKRGNMFFAKIDNHLANHKKGDMICGYCGFHGKY